MKTHLLALFTWLAPVITLDAAKARDDASVVLQLDATRLKALVNSDLAALGRLFADDLVYIHASGRVQTKDEYLALLASGDLQYLSLRYDRPPQVRTFGSATVLVTGRLQVEAKTKTGTPNRRVIVAIAVYVRREATWQLLSYQGTSVP